MTNIADTHTKTAEETGELAGRVALVTGGGSGIGAGCARRLAAASARVVIADLDQSAAERVATEIGANASAVAIDVRDPAAVDQLVTGLHATHGRLDIALNIAGIAGATAAPAEYPVDAWRDVLDVNLSGVFYSMKAEIELMLHSGGGSIVNMASIYGLVGMPVNIAYTAAKHGVVGITRAAALAYAQSGIRINAVAPAVIDTPLIRQAPQEVVAHVVALHPIGRIGRISEVAELVAFLASDRSSFCTGGVYPLDGAFTAA
jgi:NAD(P)-dependent dehydrogenase (short-subunit alcohol dehydrogenase family)